MRVCMYEGKRILIDISGTRVLFKISNVRVFLFRSTGL